MHATDIPSTATRNARQWPARRLLHWLGLTWRMLWHAPLRLLLLALVPMLVEIVLQLGIPAAGVVLSKLVVPLFSLWTLLMLDQFNRTGRFAPMQAGRRLRARPATAIALSLLSALVFVGQVIAAGVLVGPEAAAAFALGDSATLAMMVSRPQISLVLASGLPLGMLLLTSSPRALLDDVPVVVSLRDNLRLLREAWRPLGAYLLLTAGLLVAMPYQAWLLVPILLLGYVSYWIYRDAFADRLG
ncbi:hypothetical protein Q0S19_10480 [Stenotrophomonas indicatrix]|uniref:hypothetical protein n=1 Tax=Stenotrophomonas indicatrix TaxID=2045451 RepID=UPI00264CF015|nr:hypothetical protein [Stenotrophomonas indicatrix]MDN8644891.1 hypothetical protein [Stenotrophomonas indicatrix]MDN8655508.1 hypothetical protein [Stenotrophomonas indicatrix]